MRFLLLAALFSITLVLPVTVFAQSISSIGSADSSPFTISITPEYPAPYSQGVISLVSSSLDLTNAIMAVSIASKEIYRGAVQPIAIPLGKTGSVASVKVTVSIGGLQYSQMVYIQPQDVVLAVEPISSAPPLYPGIPLVPIDGGVRVVAMANLKDARGKTVDPGNLSYAWTVDNAQIFNSSGIGKQALMVASPLQFRTRSVSVIVRSQDGSLVGGASLRLMSQEPSVRIYQNDPLLGIGFDHALSGNYTISGTEKTLYAAPFSLPTTRGAPNIQWFLNGSSAQTGNLITLRPTGKGEGTASLSLVASGNSSVTATAELSLSFGGTSGFNFFGL